MRGEIAGFYPKYPPNSQSPQWQAIGDTQGRHGAIGAAEWTGVRLADVLKAAGLFKSIWATGLDSISYGHVIPLEKALEPDTLIAVKMNGEALPADHGFPARLLCLKNLAQVSAKPGA